VYADDSPQTKAAKASGEARRRRVAERKAREERHARYHLGRAPGHPFVCVCDACEAVRAESESGGGRDV
jgi:hypothetical protein